MLILVVDAEHVGVKYIVDVHVGVSAGVPVTLGEAVGVRD